MNNSINSSNPVFTQSTQNFSIVTKLPVPIVALALTAIAGGCVFLIIKSLRCYFGRVKPKSNILETPYTPEITPPSSHSSSSSSSSSASSSSSPISDSTLETKKELPPLSEKCIAEIRRLIEDVKSQRVTCAYDEFINPVTLVPLYESIDEIQEAARCYQTALDSLKESILESPTNPSSFNIKINIAQLCYAASKYFHLDVDRTIEALGSALDSVDSPKRYLDEVLKDLQLLARTFRQIKAEIKYDECISKARKYIDNELSDVPRDTDSGIKAHIRAHLVMVNMGIEFPGFLDDNEIHNSFNIAWTSTNSYLEDSFGKLSYLIDILEVGRKLDPKILPIPLHLMNNEIERLSNSLETLQNSESIGPNYNDAQETEKCTRELET